VTPISNRHRKKAYETGRLQDRPARLARLYNRGRSMVAPRANEAGALIRGKGCATSSGDSSSPGPGRMPSSTGIGACTNSKVLSLSDGGSSQTRLSAIPSDHCDPFHQDAHLTCQIFSFLL
jgi:hypothetical protein